MRIMRDNADHQEELLDEQWRRMDNGSKFTPWYRLMKELGKQVLLI
jgi:hypothetical protein